MKQKRPQLDTIIMENGGLIKPVRAARKKYDIYLEQRRSEKKRPKEQKNRKLQRNTLQDLCKSFDEEFVKLMEEAEKKMNLKMQKKQKLD